MGIEPRKILHVDMDAFYASVEQRDDPSLRGRPVVVAWKGARSVVCAASYEARRFGIRSAMPAVRAERLCPEAVFVPPDFVRYKSVSRHVREIFSRHTDLIEPLSLDEAYLDVTTTKSAFPSATETAEQIRREIRSELSLTASAGVAPNKFLAKIASDWRKPDGLFVIRPAQVDAFVAGLPVGKLPGVGKVTEARLAAMGLASCHDLRRMGAAALERAFGRWGLRLHDLAFGIDEHAVVTERPSLQVSAEDTFESDLLISEIEPHIRSMAAKAWAGYVRERQVAPDRAARTITLKLKTSEFRILTRSMSPSVFPQSESALAELAMELRVRVDLPRRTRYRLVGVALGNIRGSDEALAQRDLFPR